MLCIPIPEEYGGSGGTLSHEAIVPHHINSIGTDEQKNWWPPSMASGEIVAVMARTGPARDPASPRRRRSSAFERAGGRRLHCLEGETHHDRNHRRTAPGIARDPRPHPRHPHGAAEQAQYGRSAYDRRSRSSAQHSRVRSGPVARRPRRRRESVLCGDGSGGHGGHCSSCSFGSNALGVGEDRNRLSGSAPSAAIFFPVP